MPNIFFQHCSCWYLNKGQNKYWQRKSLQEYLGEALILSKVVVLDSPFVAKTSNNCKQRFVWLFLMSLHNALNNVLMVSLHMKTSQIICSTNQLNGFYIMDSHYAWMDEWMNEWMNLYDEWFINRFYIKILSIGKYCDKKTWT